MKHKWDVLSFTSILNSVQGICAHAKQNSQSPADRELLLALYQKARDEILVGLAAERYFQRENVAFFAFQPISLTNEIFYVCECCADKIVDYSLRSSMPLKKYRGISDTLMICSLCHFVSVVMIPTTTAPNTEKLFDIYRLGLKAKNIIHSTDNSTAKQNIRLVLMALLEILYTDDFSLHPNLIFSSISQSWLVLVKFIVLLLANEIKSEEESK